MNARVVIEGGEEDLVVTLKQFGRRLFITTDRPSIARSIGRQIVQSVLEANEDESAPEPTEEPKENTIGFHIE